MWPGAAVAVLLISGAIGCSSWRYIRDPTPDIENARQEYVVNNPGNRYNDDIASGRVRKGMSRLQVRVAWGDPDEVAQNRERTAEVWAYQEYEASRGSSVYLLHFDGELLTQVDIDRAGALPSSEAESAPVARPDRGNASAEGAGKKPGGRG
jgi:hypothetical protein